MPFRPHSAILLITLSLLSACARPPAEGASNSTSQKLPFDREPRSTGISPSQSLLPSASKLPEGTPIPIRLGSALSSARAHAGDTFSATLDVPIVIDGQTLLARGTSATGRVLEAKSAASFLGRSMERPLEPGYLRIVLVSLNVDGRQVMIETSSIFAKGGPREERNPAAGTASGPSQKNKDIVLGINRRLNFRLAQNVDLQAP